VIGGLLTFFRYLHTAVPTQMMRRRRQSTIAMMISKLSANEVPLPPPAPLPCRLVPPLTVGSGDDGGRVGPLVVGAKVGHSVGLIVGVVGAVGNPVGTPPKVGNMDGLNAGDKTWSVGGKLKPQRLI
jgi:hypothetical protein